MKLAKKAAQKLLSILLPKSAYYRLARFYRARVLGKFEPRIIERLYGGHLLKLQLRDVTGQGWYDCEWPLPAEMKQFMGRSLKPGARVFDLGAHQGVVALMLSRFVLPEGEVVAVEADSSQAAIANENKELNQAANLTVVLAAVAEKESGEIPESSGHMNRLYDWNLCGVARSTIDGLAVKFGVPDLVYMDIDGYEIQALRGAATVLASKADWFVEIHVNAGLEQEGGTWQQVLEYFPAEQFERLICDPDRGGYVPFDPASPILESRFFMVAFHRA